MNMSKTNRSYLETIKLIRKLTIISLFADDLLMNTFVLKGGNLMDIAFGISDRASIDIDVSMSDDFPTDKLEDIRYRLERALIKTFDDHDLQVFDVTLAAKPKEAYAAVKDFWGGYLLLFKAIDKAKAASLSLEAMRKQALLLGPDNSAKFKVDISKFEYCDNKEAITIDDYTIYVYSSVMFVYEKLRAICQQIPSYTAIIHQQPRQRARDFYDIYTIVNKLELESSLFLAENLQILQEIFAAKKVPVDLLLEIKKHSDFHADSFASVVDTVTDKSKLQAFDFYRDYVSNLAARLKPSGEK